MVHLPVAGGLRNVYDVTEVERQLQENEGSSNQMLTRTLQKMLSQGGERYVVKPWSPSTLDWLYEACPNFSGVLDDLRAHLALALDNDEPMSFMPLMLAGDPGVGKTYFAKCLAQALGTDFVFVSMGSMTAGFVLGGSAPTWQGAKFGRIAGQFIEGKLANPVFLLDELDKSGGDSRYDPFGTLLQLLEGDTSRHFRDEFLDVPMDCSAVLWVGTANDIDAIPSYIQSRMAVYEVPKPTAEQSAHVARRVYAALHAEVGAKLVAVLENDVLDLVAGIPPRELRKRMLSAMGQARLAGRDRLTPGDFSLNNARRKQSIGFTA